MSVNLPLLQSSLINKQNSEPLFQTKLKSPGINGIGTPTVTEPLCVLSLGVKVITVPKKWLA